MLFRRGLLSLLALLVTAGLVAGCGGSGDSKSSGGGGDTGSDDPTALLKKAFATDIQSGTVKIELSADIQGGSQFQGPVKASLEGPFQSRGKDKAPLLDWTYDFSGAGAGLNGKLVATEDNAYLGFRGQTYEVGKGLYKQFTDQAKSSGQKNVTAADLGVKPEEWLKDPKVSSGPSIGGDSTKQVSGGVDAEKMVRDLIKASQNSTVRNQLQRQGRSVPKVSDSEIKKVSDALENPTFKVAVDDKDRIRQADFTTSFKAPEGSSSTGPTGGKITFSLSFPEVDTKPSITAPSDAKAMQLLFQQLGGLGAGGLGGLKTN